MKVMGVSQHWPPPFVPAHTCSLWISKYMSSVAVVSIYNNATEKLFNDKTNTDARVS